ncbi:hypothetical protein DMENIID0001_028540 [Sergentomyia squamirostris]
MSQFNYINEINYALGGMDSELTKGPMPRWQKKLETSTSSTHNSSVNNSKLSVSYNKACGGAPGSGKTPNKSIGECVFGKKTPSGKSPGRKTPSGKSPGRKTPGSKERAKTPTAGDRFIPSRANSNFELGHYMINKEQQKEAVTEEQDQVDNTKRTLAQSEQRRLLAETLQGESSSQRILSYQIKAPSAPDSHQNPLKVVYSTKTPVSTKSGTRYIPHAPERILDAPDIINDYCEYL